MPGEVVFAFTGSFHDFFKLFPARGHVAQLASTTHSNNRLSDSRHAALSLFAQRAHQRLARQAVGASARQPLKLNFPPGAIHAFEMSLSHARARAIQLIRTRANVLRRSSRVPRQSRPRRRALPRPRSLPRRRPCRALIASSPGACPSESSSRWPCRSGPFVMRCQPPSRGGRRAR